MEGVRCPGNDNPFGGGAGVDDHYGDASGICDRRESSGGSKTSWAISQGPDAIGLQAQPASTSCGGICLAWVGIYCAEVSNVRMCCDRLGCADSMVVVAYYFFSPSITRRKVQDQSPRTLRTAKPHMSPRTHHEHRKEIPRRPTPSMSLRVLMSNHASSPLKEV